MLEVQLTVAVPDPVTLAGLMAPQVRPAGTLSVSETVPANPLTAVTVMVEVSELMTTAAEGELAVTVKSTKLKVAVAE